MNFVEIARFASRLEAETIGHALDEHGIPFLVQAPDIGIFGPGFSGANPAGGAALLVPDTAVETVRELLTCVVRPLEEGELPSEVIDTEGDTD
ncbi:MAG: DUF2007 domain-containing protein [Thermoanaerobaculia bacterium]|nr:DUF2007 domain-containing protein [Thermoanaerobaculia bacterium]